MARLYARLRSSLRALEILTASLLLLAGAAHASEPITIKLGTLAPAGSAWHERLKELAHRWDAESGGRVRLRVYAGGTQGSEGDMIRKLGIGQLQAAALSNVGLHDLVPEPQVLSVPLLFRDDAELGCALERLRPALDRAIEARGYLALQWTRLGTAFFFCTAPYRTPAELASARLFAWDGDPAMVEAWIAAGFRPVVLSSVDLVPSLQTRMVDCVDHVPVYVLTGGIFERARYRIDLPLGKLVATTLVRRDAWERIPADLRPILAASAREVGLSVDAESRRLEEQALGAMARQGLQTVPVDPGPWRAVLERSWSVLRGASVPARVFDEALAARDACRGQARR